MTLVRLHIILLLGIFSSCKSLSVQGNIYIGKKWENKNISEVLNRALATAETETLVINIEKGTYIINETIHFRGNTVITGNNATILGNTKSNAPLFLLKDVSDVTISNLKIDARKKLPHRKTPSSLNKGIHIQSKSKASKNISILDLSISNTAGPGIFFQGRKVLPIDSILIENVTIFNTSFGILGNQVRHLKIENSKISTRNGSGVQLSKSKEIEIQGNKITNCVYGHGIALTKCSSINVSDNRASNQSGNLKEHYGGWGIVMSVECSDFVISNNVCNSNEVGGITADVTPSATPRYRIDTKGSVIKNNTCSNNIVHGISTNYAMNVTVENNLVENNKMNGIAIYNSVGIKVLNNRCNSNRNHGIRIGARNNISVSKIIIRDNKTANNKKSDISVSKKINNYVLQE